MRSNPHFVASFLAPFLACVLPLAVSGANDGAPAGSAGRAAPTPPRTEASRPLSGARISPIETRASGMRLAWTDLAGDGDDEIVAISYGGMLHVQSRGTTPDPLCGDERWSFDLGGHPFELRVADLDGDGGPKEIIAASASGAVHALDCKGALRWRYESPSGAPLYALAADALTREPLPGVGERSTRVPVLAGSLRILDLSLVDSDADGITDGLDNCVLAEESPARRDPDQSDADRDGFGDLCDPLPQRSSGLPCAGRSPCLEPDPDEDAVSTPADNGPWIYNPGQEDRGGSGSGDACEANAGR